MWSALSHWYVKFLVNSFDSNLIWNIALSSKCLAKKLHLSYCFLDWRNSNELGHFLRSQLDELSWTLVLLFLQQRGWMHLWTCFAKLLKNAAGLGVALASWEDQTLVSFPQAYHHNGTKIFANWISIKLSMVRRSQNLKKSLTCFGIYSGTWKQVGWSLSNFCGLFRKPEL